MTKLTLLICGDGLIGEEVISLIYGINMTINLSLFQQQHAPLWDRYVLSHHEATLYHMFLWKAVIERTYGHKTYYLAAFDKSEDQVKGVLPLVHLNHFVFGRALISLPFFDMAGVLANDEETEKALLSQAVTLGKALKVKDVELRHTCSNSCFKEISLIDSVAWDLEKNKVRMLLDLPDSSFALMKSFKSKLRSQIKRPLKAGLKAQIGGIELLDKFYQVFLINMRDLGSPVHARTLFQNVLEQFHENTRVVIVQKGNIPCAASIISGFKTTLENPWASSLRKYSHLSPNMLLYWTMLEYACECGYKRFDFGRSSPGEGTYRFKRQWGAQPKLLYWYRIHLNDNRSEMAVSNKSKFERAIQYWQKLPVSVTALFGPMIRKYIGL
ncbi:FemAB family XrtA/PEP-CTERM system-associated protein [Desulfocicer vacuolatum]|nr:FemAB family XrtA/PEP-CTERM system-associated protein [Desulfocicer vacuolatum]